MTAFFGLCFVLAILAMLPLVFCCAGKDTEQRRASARERQEEAMMDWTDKDLIAAERVSAETAGKRSVKRSLRKAQIETVNRDSLPQFAA